jgi:hypothetical protein
MSRLPAPPSPSPHADEHGSKEEASVMERNNIGGERERDRGGVQPACTWSRSGEARRSRSRHRRARRRGRPVATRIASAAARCAELTSATRVAKRKTMRHSPVSSAAVGDGDAEAMASRSGGTARESGWVMVVDPSRTGRADHGHDECLR